MNSLVYHTKIYMLSHTELVAYYTSPQVNIRNTAFAHRGWLYH